MTNEEFFSRPLPRTFSSFLFRHTTLQWVHHPCSSRAWDPVWCLREWVYLRRGPRASLLESCARIVGTTQDSMSQCRSRPLGMAHGAIS